MDRNQNTQYVLSLSYGKDSLACLEAIKQLGYPLDRIIHAEIWATDSIPADLPPMVEFKNRADDIIKSRYGLTVEHIYATDKSANKRSFNKQFYTMRYKKSIKDYCRYGFPCRKGPWCTSKLKTTILDKQSKDQEIVKYLGIAADEPKRIERHNKANIILPLVDIGWSEDYCRKWCEENDLLSPIYTTAARGGCWFCHNQPIDQLRQLRTNYPELWQLLLKWDKDSPVSFHSDGHTVHDFDKRFYAEELGLVPSDRKFRWKELNKILYSGKETNHENKNRKTFYRRDI